MLQYNLNELSAYLHKDWEVVALYCAVVIIWLFSGCLASSIAETRSRGPLLHFILGLLFPIAYPVLALFLGTPEVKQKRKREKEEPDVEHVEGPPPVEIEADKLDSMAAAAPHEIHAESLDERGQFTPEFFKDLALDEYGNYRGPFVFVVSGEELRADRIVECMPDQLVTESITPDGKSQRLRVPYKNIESFEEL